MIESEIKKNKYSPIIYHSVDMTRQINIVDWITKIWDPQYYVFSPYNTYVNLCIYVKIIKQRIIRETFFRVYIDTKMTNWTYKMSKLAWHIKREDVFLRQAIGDRLHRHIHTYNSYMQ